MFEWFHNPKYQSILNPVCTGGGADLPALTRIPKFLDFALQTYPCASTTTFVVLVILDPDQINQINLQMKFDSCIGPWKWAQ